MAYNDDGAPGPRPPVFRDFRFEDLTLTGRCLDIAVPNSGSLTSAQAATASVGGVNALGSARFAYQKEQTLTAAASGTVAALCVQPGAVVGAGSNIVQLTSDSLDRQVEQAADSLRSAQLSVEDAMNTLDNYTITAPISGTVIRRTSRQGRRWATRAPPLRPPPCASSTTCATWR